MNVTIQSNFDGTTQRIIAYQDIIDPKSVRKYSYSFITFDTSTYPLILRILTQKKNSEFSISMTSGGLHPTSSQTAFYDSGYTNDCSYKECNLWAFVQPDIFAVYLAFFVVLIIVIICAVYVLFLWKCPERINASKKVNGLDSTPFASTNALLEARTEPAGYFAVDHHIDDDPQTE